MRRQKAWKGKVYRTYRPYPVSERDGSRDYAPEGSADDNGTPDGPFTHDSFDDFSELAGDAGPLDWPLEEPPRSNDSFRPLKMLQSLFADRLSFLQRAVEELEESKREREKLTGYAMRDLDPEIRHCEETLALLVDERLLDDREYRQGLERRLFNLKRERRREAVHSWRDIVSLRAQIRKLQRELDALGRTAGSARNRDPPR